jgi:site-specific recombinase XerD
LNVSKALTGFLQYKSAEGLAPVTVTGYERDLKLWIEYQGDLDIITITSQQILSFLKRPHQSMARRASARST